MGLFSSWAEKSKTTQVEETKENVNEITDKKELLDALKTDWRNIAKASEELKKDREIIESTLTQKHLQYGSLQDELYKEYSNKTEFKNMCLLANSKSIFEFVSKEFRNDKDIVLTEAMITPQSLFYASDDIKNDRKIVLQVMDSWAVGANEMAVKFAGKELQNDKSFMLEAVRRNGINLQYASEELRNDDELVLTAAKNNVYALHYASERLKKDETFAVKTVMNNADAIRFLDKKLSSDVNFLSRISEMQQQRQQQINDQIQEQNNIQSTLKLQQQEQQAKIAIEKQKQEEERQNQLKKEQEKQSKINQIKENNNAMLDLEKQLEELKRKNTVLEQSLTNESDGISL